MIALLLAAVVTCAGVDDTAAIQAAVNAGDVTLRGDCAVAPAGVRIPSDRAVDSVEATMRALPCGLIQMCRVYETVPGARGVHILAGDIIGPGTASSAPGFAIGIRIDSAHDVVVMGARLRGWGTDGVTITGNTRPTNVRLDGVTVQDSGRNGLSIVNAQGVTIERCVFSGIRGDPGAGIDIEPSGPGDEVHDVLIFDVDVYDNQKGIVAQPGKGTVTCTNLAILRSRISDNTTHQVIVNAFDGGLLWDLVAEGPGIGVSVGGHVEARRAHRITVTGNKVSSDRPLVLAGVADSKIFDNKLGKYGGYEAPVLGVRGEMYISGNKGVD